MRKLATALVILAVVAVGVWFGFTRPVSPPRIVNITALDKSGAPVRTMASDVVLSPDEALDFHVELATQGWVYVFRALGGRAMLEWGPTPRTPPLQKGVWAPDWEDERVKGLKFATGPNKVYVLLAPQPIFDVSSWTAADLESPRAKCTRCSTATLSLRVTERVAPDAGT